VGHKRSFPCSVFSQAVNAIPVSHVGRVVTVPAPSICPAAGCWPKPCCRARSCWLCAPLVTEACCPRHAAFLFLPEELAVRKSMIWGYECCVMCDREDTLLWSQDWDAVFVCWGRFWGCFLFLSAFLPSSISLVTILPWRRWELVLKNTLQLGLLNKTLFYGSEKFCPSSLTQDLNRRRCPGFGWDRVSFPPSSCCVLDLEWEECG